MKPLVSVLIDTYNHERYIEQAILSAVEQDFPAADYEIVVVDDGSTDRTPEIVQKFAPRVRLLRKKNGGQASALNAGIAETQGEAVAFLDGDDWFAPGKLTAVMSALEQHPEGAAVGHGYYEVKESTQEVTVHAAPQTKLLALANPHGAREALLSMPFLHNAALTVRRRVLERVIPIPEALILCADAPLCMVSMAMGLILLDRPFHYYRLHAHNLYAGVNPKDDFAMRRKCEIEQLVFEQLETLLRRLGVSQKSVEALLYPWWTECSRFSLRTFGGKRSQAFRTEMRAFRSQYENPDFAYSLFTYLVVGSATLLLPPQRFYAVRDWYGQKNLGRRRRQLVGSR
jgi:glycosyltransferase involved in cell wall biosynthesis